MLTSERQLSKSSKKQNSESPFTYEEEFYADTLCCCLYIRKRLVFIKNHTLYIYEGSEGRVDDNSIPQMFFYLNATHSHCTILNEGLQISNVYQRIYLRHPKGSKILRLMEAINKAATNFQFGDRYIKKNRYFESSEQEQLKKP